MILKTRTKNLGSEERSQSLAEMAGQSRCKICHSFFQPAYRSEKVCPWCKPGNEMSAHMPEPLNIMPKISGMSVIGVAA